MAVTHTSSMRSLISDQVTAQADVGTTQAIVSLQASASTEIVTCQMAATSFGVSSSGLSTAAAIQDGTASTAGTVTLGQILSSTQRNEVCAFSVTSTGGGGDLELSSNVISSGQTVSITSLSYTAPS